MKPHYYYGVDAYGNIHAFKSKGYRTELIDADKIRALTFATLTDGIELLMRAFK